MKTNFHYDTAAIAIASLKRQGFVIDFNLRANRLIAPGNNYDVDNFQIRDIYRYEGDSDPADEVIIYAIESGAGEKGIFVAAYRIAPDEGTAMVISRLKKAN